MPSESDQELAEPPIINVTRTQIDYALLNHVSQTLQEGGQIPNDVSKRLLSFARKGLAAEGLVEAIEKHRMDIWGDGTVDHGADSDLYIALSAYREATKE